jgi:hypothetical protein
VVANSDETEEGGDFYVQAELNTREHRVVADSDETEEGGGYLSRRVTTAGEPTGGGSRRGRIEAVPASPPREISRETGGT